MVDYLAEFEASLHRIHEPARADTFYARFYERFIASDSAMGTMFSRTDMQHQMKMLRESLTELREFSTSLKSNNYIVSLARIHGIRGRQVKPDSYDSWLNALAETVREVDPESNLQTELAWRLVLAPGIEFLKFYYDK